MDLMEYLNSLLPVDGQWHKVGLVAKKGEDGIVFLDQTLEMVE